MSNQRFANVNDVPLALAIFLASDFYDYNDEQNTISATTLLKPLRQIVLPPRIPPGQGLPNLADMLNSRMGTAIHDGIERAWRDNHVNAMLALGYPQRIIDRVQINPEHHELTEGDIPIYLEQRLQRQLGKWNITGKFDFIGEGRVQDFKSTSVFTYQKQTNADKWAWQGSLYRWLDPKKITQSEMEIHYIFTDWKANLAKTDPSYPTKQFLTQRIPLFSLSETENFVSNKLSLIDQYWSAEEQDIPPCTDEELWRTEPMFKYYKNGNTSAKRSTKNFDSRQDALIYMSQNGNAGAIKEVPGQVTACKYCPAFMACSQKDTLIASGDLVLGA